MYVPYIFYGARNKFPRSPLRPQGGLEKAFEGTRFTTTVCSGGPGVSASFILQKLPHMDSLFRINIEIITSNLDGPSGAHFFEIPSACFIFLVDTTSARTLTGAGCNVCKKRQESVKSVLERAVAARSDAPRWCNVATEDETLLGATLHFYGKMYGDATLQSSTLHPVRKCMETVATFLERNVALVLPGERPSSDLVGLKRPRAKPLALGSRRARGRVSSADLACG